MYPSRDFRCLIQSQPQEAMRAISREPFSEVLQYWAFTNRPSDLLSIYQQGLAHAILNDRYPYPTLECTLKYPEFLEIVVQALEQRWLQFNFALTVCRSDLYSLHYVIQVDRCSDHQIPPELKKLCLTNDVISWNQLNYQLDLSPRSSSLRQTYIFLKNESCKILGSS